MAQEKTTIARPYAEAVFDRAQETDTLDLWSDMLALLSAVVVSPEISGLIDNPKLSRARLKELLLEIGGGRLSEEGQNLVRVLVDNDRIALLAHIAALYERLKHERQGKLQVQVAAAYALNKAQEQALADALKERLGRDIEITAEKDASLIGGIVIRAGDLVIDGSVRGQLKKLANELSI
jgi:F-type H+-transporting ATPase subunit delta